MQQNINQVKPVRVPPLRFLQEVILGFPVAGGSNDNVGKNTRLWRQRDPCWYTGRGDER